MNFPIINADDCPPDNCGAPQAIELRPGLVLLCLGNTFQFSAYLGALKLTTGLTYSSSDASILTIDSSTGLATVIGVGIAVVTVAWQGLTSTGKAAVVTSNPGVNCCDDMQVRIVVLGDESESMHAPFGASNRRDLTHGILYYGLTLSTRIKGATILFSDAALLYQPFTDSGLIYPPALPVSLITPGQTNISSALDLALTTLATDPGQQQIIVLFSDGLVRPEMGETNLLDASQEFKEGGGVIIVFGLGATAEGFELLQQIASSGFFVNVIPPIASLQTLADQLKNMLCLLCASDRPISGYVDYSYAYGCAAFDNGPQVPDPNDYGDVEEDVEPQPPPNLPQLPPVTFVPTTGELSNSSPTITLSVPGFPEAFIRFTYLVGGLVYPADPTFTFPSSLATGKDYDGAFSPIPMPSSVQKVWIKAVAKRPGYNNSTVSSAVYPA